MDSLLPLHDTYFFNTPNVAYVALGSNLGDREENLRRAVESVEKLPRTTLLKRSRWYNTSPKFYEEQPVFLNGAISLETYYRPQYLLRELLRIETELGRVRRLANGPRTIDLDLLAMSNIILGEHECEAYDCDGISLPSLNLPHPGLEDREFVLYPMRDIAADYVHPLTQVTIETLFGRLDLPHDEIPVPISNG